MTIKNREIPRQIATFGEQQYRETDALAVEVLRVKAAAIRRYLRELGPTSYLVAVISLDRVRLYYLTETGVMLGADNIDHESYKRVREVGRLLVKFERPREPTPEELRMNATEELRNLLSKSIRRVTRMLGVSEPRFPEMYVSRERLGEHTQSFGTLADKDGALYFAEASVNAPWVEGIALRMAFLLCCGADSMRSDFGALVGNAVAYSNLRPSEQAKWLEIWTTHTKGGPWVPFLNHFVRHAETYTQRGYSILRSLITNACGVDDVEKWARVLQVVHDGVELSLSTEQYHLIRGLCESLSSPRQLVQKRHTLLAAHLAPRTLCNVNAMGSPLSVDIKTENPALETERWLDVEYLAGSQTRHLVIEPGTTQPLKAVRYILNIEDIVPKTGGLISQGASIVRHASVRLGLKNEWSPTYTAQINLRDAPGLPADQLAVLQRLAEGRSTILSDTLIGSLNRVEALLASEHIVLLPDFNHLGIRMNLLIIGDEKALPHVCEHTLETTAFVTSDDTYMVVATASIWHDYLIDLVSEYGLQVYPIVRTESRRGLVRSEELLPESMDRTLWT